MVKDGEKDIVTVVKDGDEDIVTVVKDGDEDSGEGRG